jgi:hypothetical protein
LPNPSRNGRRHRGYHALAVTGFQLRRIAQPCVSPFSVRGERHRRGPILPRRREGTPGFK